MIEQLIYMKLNQSGSNVLLYTLNEPYNGRNDFLKIYAAEFDDNNEAKVTKMSDELHNEIKSAISSLANGNLNNITVLNEKKLNTENLQGKAYAIPSQFKDAIKKQSSILSNVNDQDNIVDAQKNDKEVGNPVISNQKVVNENTVNAFRDNSENIEPNFQNNVEIANGKPFSSSTDQETTPLAEVKSENMIVTPNSFLPDESYDITQAVPATDSKENTLTNVCEHDKTPKALEIDTKEKNECPSIEEIENSINIIKKYIEFQKNKSMEETVNTVSNSEVLKKDTAVNEPNIFETVTENQQVNDTQAPGYFEPIIDQPVFPSFNDADQNFFVEKKEDAPLEQSYVASKNISQEESSVQTLSDNQADPVVMPDNFVGKNDNNFSMEGLSPSTLNSDANIFKFVA